MKRFLVLLVVVALSLVAVADDSKLAPELQNYSSQSPLNVVIQYNRSPALLDLQGVLNLGGQILSPLNLINGVLATVPASNLLNLSNQSNVVYISPDRPLQTLLSNAAPAIKAPTAWNSGFEGSGVAIAVVDSGIAPAADLNGGFLGLSRVVYSQNFVPTSLTASDQYGHGTHIAGLIAGNGSRSTGPSYYRTFKGIAPSANLVNL